MLPERISIAYHYGIAAFSKEVQCPNPNCLTHFNAATGIMYPIVSTKDEDLSAVMGYFCSMQCLLDFLPTNYIEMGHA